MRAALYLRVSTAMQRDEGYSIDAQKERLSSFVKSQDWDIYDFYIDAGESAKDLNRPALQKMLDDMKEHRFDVVLVYKLDRLTRSVLNLHELINIFEKYNVKFKSATEVFETTTAMGRFFITLVGAMASWERETIAERVYFGQEQKHLGGERNGAIAPIGYDLVDGKLVINPAEAEFVRNLFSLYTERKGMPAITKIVHMNIRTLHYILTNPVYCGKIRWNYRKNGKRTGNEMIMDGDHEPILTEEEFERVQSIREDRTRQGKGATSDFPFTGIVKCGRCGSSMVGASKQMRNKRYRFYRCSGKVNYGSCDMPHIAESKIEEAFIRKLNLNKKELSRLIVFPEQPKESSILKEAEHELETISKRRKRWQLAFANSLIEIEELRQHLESDKSREMELREILAARPINKGPTFTKEEYLEHLIQLRKIWPEIEDDLAKKSFLEELYESITIFTDALPGYRKFSVEITEWVLK